MKLSYEHRKSAQLTYLEVRLFLFLLRQQPHIPHSTPLYSKTWQPISDMSLTDTLHDRVVHPIVGLSYNPTSTCYTGEHHKMTYVWAHLARQHIQVMCCK